MSSGHHHLPVFIVPAGTVMVIIFAIVLTAIRELIPQGVN